MALEKTARAPHTLRVADDSARCARSHIERTYIPQVGYLFSCFDMVYVCTRMPERESTARHSSTSKTMKMKPKLSKKKKKVLSRAIISYLIGDSVAHDTPVIANQRIFLSVQVLVVDTYQTRYEQVSFHTENFTR